MPLPRVTFVLMREGPSDDGLIPHLQNLIIRAGATEAIGQPIGKKGTIQERMMQLMAEGAESDLTFVHRDADGVGVSVRREEIVRAASASGIRSTVVPVIPVQELEAWLLIDEFQIRRVVGRPRGRSQLGLPRLASVESTSSPKEVLKAALLAASETTGRRRDQERKDFEKHRHALLDRLDIDGPIRSLPAWRRLELDITSAVAELSPI